VLNYLPLFIYLSLFLQLTFETWTKNFQTLLKTINTQVTVRTTKHSHHNFTLHWTILTTSLATYLILKQEYFLWEGGEGSYSSVNKGVAWNTDFREEK
jgi:hypothetical protein